MTKTVHRSARSRTARRGHAGQMTGPKPCDPDPAGAVTPATRQNWAICTIVQPRRELSRCRPAPADAALAGNSVPLRTLTASGLQPVPADVDGLLPPGLVNALHARLHDLVAERYRLSEFHHSACSRTPNIPYRPWVARADHIERGSPNSGGAG